MHTNHRSILQTLIHVMAVEESWIEEDLKGGPSSSWPEFKERYLGDEESLESVIAGWRRITAETREYLRAHPDLEAVITLAGSDRSATIEQIIYHLAGEEMIHLGEVLAMTRQLGIDLPSYFLMSIMHAADRPYEEWVGEAASADADKK